jgi:hypothetical protein
VVNIIIISTIFSIFYKQIHLGKLFYIFWSSNYIDAATAILIYFPEILEDYPELEEEDGRQSLSFSSWAISEKTIQVTA